MTIQQRLCAALLARGHTFRGTMAHGCRVYTAGTPGFQFYVGAGGSLRHGRTRATSVPFERSKAILLADVPAPPTAPRRPASTNPGAIFDPFE